MKKSLLTSLLLTLCLLGGALAQTSSDFAIPWSTVAHGGGRSVGGTADSYFAVYDTIGQSMFGSSSGGSYALDTGYLTGVAPIPYLVLLYVNGDNDLWFYMEDLVRNVQVGAAQSNAVVLMVLDGPGEKDSYLYRLEKGAVDLCNLHNNPTCNGYIPGHNRLDFSEDTANQEKLANFFITSIQQYSGAQHILAAVIGHGGGWAPDVLAGQPPRLGGQGTFGGPTELGGLLWDNHTDDAQQGNSLSTKEMGEALRLVQTTTKRKLDLLYLDACLMGMWEVAYELKDSVNYLLFSESWSWTTFTYDQHLHTLQTPQSIEQIGSAWIQNEVAELCPGNSCERTPPYTYSLLNLNVMDTFTPALDLFADQLRQILPSERHRIAQAFAETLKTGCFDSNQDYRIDELDTYCDLYSFAVQIQRHLPNREVASAAEGVKTLLREQVVVTATHRSGILPPQYPANYWEWGEDVRGMSIYLPLNLAALETHPAVRYGWKLARYNEIQASNTGWDEFLNSYWAGTAIPAQECSGSCALPGGPIDAKVRQFLPLIQR